MKNTTAMVPAALRASCNARSTTCRLAESIAAGIMQLMTVGILGTLATLILAAPAMADVPPGFTFVGCSGTPVQTVPVNHSQSCTGNYGESATADLSGTSARAAGTALDGTNNGEGGSGAQTNYYFDVLATGNFDPSVTVPVRIDTFLTTGTTGNDADFLDHTYAEADLFVHTGNISDLGLVSCSGFADPRNCDGLATVDDSVVLQLYPLSRNEVTLAASIILDSLFQSTASALADPYIRIDPAFLADHPGYSLAFSSNVTNGPIAPAPVPEPSTAWLLGSGLLALIGFSKNSAVRNSECRDR